MLIMQLILLPQELHTIADDVNELLQVLLQLLAN